MEGLSKISRFVTLNSLGLVLQLARREIAFNNLEVGVYSMNQSKFHNLCA